MFAQVELPVGGQRPGADRADFGRDRQRHAPDRAGADQARAASSRAKSSSGARSDNYVEVLEGVKDGEQVVVAANFLIDAESNLKAAVGGFGHAAHGASQRTASSRRTGSRSTATRPKARWTTSTPARHGQLNHGPVASLKWPAMTMEFKVANDRCCKA